MILKFLLWLTARLPVEEIVHQGVKFMERYYVATPFGWRIYIHRFIGSDPDGVHDHPWRYGVSLILCGWYYEERRRFMRPVTRRKHPKKFEAAMAKFDGKKKAAHDWGGTRIAYYWGWVSFGAFKRHTLAHNESVRIIEINGKPIDQ